MKYNFDILTKSCFGLIDETFLGANGVAHLHVKVPAHSVDADAMEPAVRQVVEGGAEHVGVPVRLQVIPDLQAPCDTCEGKEGGRKDAWFQYQSAIEAR